MKKHFLLTTALTIGIAGGIFAQDFHLSAGGGVILRPEFIISDANWDKHYVDGGFVPELNLFFDATYAEFNVNFWYGAKDIGVKCYDSVNLSLSLFGKYPFRLNERFTIFPFAGVDYVILLGAWLDGDSVSEIAVRTKARSAEKKTYAAYDFFNKLAIIAGCGVDFALTDALFLRGEIGFGFVFNTKFEDENLKSKFEGKIPVKLAIGYSFY